jgi:hypothetical protein
MLLYRKVEGMILFLPENWFNKELDCRLHDINEHESAPV